MIEDRILERLLDKLEQMRAVLGDTRRYRRGAVTSRDEWAYPSTSW